MAAPRRPPGSALTIYTLVTVSLVLSTIAVGFHMGTWPAVKFYLAGVAVVVALSIALAFGGRRG